MVNLEAKALVVDSTLKVHFFDKTTGERVPMWDKEKVSLQKLLGQDKLNQLTDQIMLLRLTVQPPSDKDNEEVLTEELLSKLTEEANKVLQDLTKE